MNSRPFPLILLISCLLILIPACSEDDIPTVPVIPTIEDPLLASLSQEGAVISQGFIDMIPAWAQGDLGGKETTPPTWDPSCNCWRWSSNEGDVSDPLHTWGRNWSFALTIYQGETPQMEFEGADRIQVDIGYGYNASDYRDESNNSNTNFFINMELEITDFTAGMVYVEAVGLGEFSGYFMADGEYSQIYKEIILSLILTIPFGDCPSGGLDLDMDTTSFSLGFDGTTTAWWYYSVGPGDPEKGSINFVCGG